MGSRFVNGRIHTMDDQNRIVSAVAIRNGRFVSVGNASNPGPGKSVINLHGRTVVPGSSRATRISSASRTVPAITWRNGNLLRTLRRSWRCSQRAGRVFRRASSSRRWVPARRGCSPSCACRRSPRSTRRCPTGRCSSTKAAADPRAPTRSANSSSRARRARSPGPCVVGADGSLATVAGVNNANRALYHLRIRQTFEDKKRSALDAMAYSAQRWRHHEPRPDAGCGGHRHARSGLARSAADARAVQSQPLSHVRRVARAAPRGQGVRPAADQLPAQPGIHPGARQSSITSCPSCANGSRTSSRSSATTCCAPAASANGRRPLPTPANPNGYAVWYEAQRLVAKARWRNENAQAGSPTSTANIEQVVATYEAMDAGIRHQGTALGPAARRPRDAESARPPEER